MGAIVGVRGIHSEPAASNTGDHVRADQTASRVFLAAVATGTLTVLLAGSAAASIATVSGQIQEIAPPSSVVKNAGPQSNTTAFAFDEKQGYTLEQALTVDVTEPGTYNTTTNQPDCGDPDGTPAGSPRGTVPAGTVVDSHFLFADLTTFTRGDTPTVLEGTVTFDKPILGLIFCDEQLRRSDGDAGRDLGVDTTAYPSNDATPTTSTFRGLDFDFAANGQPGTGNDSITLAADRMSIEVTLRLADHIDQVRVVTGEDNSVEPVVPEVPVALLLPLTGAAVLASTVAIRRRRSDGSATA